MARRQAAGPYQQGRLGGQGGLSQSGRGVQEWQVPERGTQTQAGDSREVSIRTKKAGCAVCTQ